MTYEFIYEFMYMKNIVKSYLNSCVPRFQMAEVTRTARTRVDRVAEETPVNRTSNDTARAVSDPAQRAGP